MDEVVLSAELHEEVLATLAGCILCLKAPGIRLLFKGRGKSTDLECITSATIVLRKLRGVMPPPTVEAA